MDRFARVARWVRCVIGGVVCAAFLAPGMAPAASTIAGPAGSAAFGTHVALVQTGGNFAVTDPNAGGGAGAVYLYTASGTLLSTLTGSAAGDHVGSGGIVVLPNGKFVVSSPNWANGGVAGAGAVTLVDGAQGLSGAVSPANSLVGSSAGDQIGSAPLVDGVTRLPNGNFVVISPNWSDGATAGVGAATWVDANAGLTGAVSASNSLIGTSANDRVGSGGAIALANGAFVVSSDRWHGGVGAVTWSGSAGVHDTVSAANSLVGSQGGDAVGGGYEQGTGVFGQPGQTFRVGGVVALSNGNYVVLSPHWANGTATIAGAATWCRGDAPTSAAVSAANSLVGSVAGDYVGSAARPLGNGNYVVSSPDWSNAGAQFAGAATWGDGSRGVTGVISAANSLVGTHERDGVGYAVALSNGNYVVASSEWNNSGTGALGAVTWGDGMHGVSGEVSSANSFVGANGGDLLGFGGVVPLPNGNYVIDTYDWTNGGASAAGAVTWADGTKALIGTISASNSLVGSAAEDSVGIGGVTVLPNGDYVVDSWIWRGQVGAVTWGDGTKGVTGAVSAANSLVGASANDALGSGGVVALANGNYVIESYAAKIGGAEFTGAATWVDASGTRTGTLAISAANSLVGAHAGDGLSGMHVLPAQDGNYAVYFPRALAASGQTAGAVVLASGSAGLAGTLNGSIAAYGVTAGTTFSLDYDAAHRQLIVGRPSDDAVSLLRLAGPAITAGGYLSGNWYDAAQPGHGFQLEFATDNVMVGIWFVYAPDGSGQNWIYAQGSYDPTSASVTLPAVLLTNAKFPPNFVPADVVRTDWGSLTFAFADCNNATVTWNSTLPAYGVGSLPLTRLTQIAGTSCP